MCFILPASAYFVKTWIFELFLFVLVSSEVPENPVLSPYGHIYERRLVEKYIAQNGTDPVTEQPLTVDQLIDIKSKY